MFQMEKLCAAKHNDRWYRSKVTNLSRNDFHLFLVDYGNVCILGAGSVFELEQHFVNALPAQAVLCTLHSRDAGNAHQADRFVAGLVGRGNDLDLAVVGRDGSMFVVDVLNNNSVSNSNKSSDGPVANIDHASEERYIHQTVEPGKTVPAYTSYIKSPQCMWVQLADTDDELESLMETLGKHYSVDGQLSLSSPYPGQPCVALYQEDHKWYRASVVSVQGSRLNVLFVDYGNEDIVDISDVRPMARKFIIPHVFSMQCCLHGYTGPVSDGVVGFLEDYTRDIELLVTFIDETNVTVKVGEHDVLDALAERGFVGQKCGTPETDVLKNLDFNNRISPLSTPERGHGDTLLEAFQKSVPSSGTTEGMISYIDEDSGFMYVQLLSTESQINQLALRLQQVYSFGGHCLTSPPFKGMPCCTKYEADGSWYRSVVEDVKDGMVNLQFVDYGNHDVVPAASLKTITAEFFQVPLLVFQCILDGLLWKPSMAELIWKHVLEKTFNICFVTFEPPFQIQISVNGQDLFQVISRTMESSASGQKYSNGLECNDEKASLSIVGLRSDALTLDVKSGYESIKTAFVSESHLPIECSQDDSAKHKYDGSADGEDDDVRQTELCDVGDDSSASLCNAFVEMNFPRQAYEQQKIPGGTVGAFVSHVHDDGTFFVQLSADMDIIDALSTRLDALPSSQQLNAKIGTVCAAKFLEDDLWYRGIVKSVSGSTVDIAFVDFGNQQSCEIASIKPLPTNLLGPPLAYHCQFRELGHLTKDRQIIFRQASDDIEYHVSFSGSTPFDVEIRDCNGANLVSSLFKLDAFWQQEVPVDPVPVTVSSINDNGQFYLQLTGDAEQLTSLSARLQAACMDCGEVELDGIHVGMNCSVRLSDGLRYRAIVIDVEADTVLVSFEDYGSCGAVDRHSLCFLPAEFYVQPLFALKCTLQEVDKWETGYTETFRTMTSGKTFTASFVTRSSPYSVQLTRSVGQDLLQSALASGTGTTLDVEADEGCQLLDTGDFVEINVGDTKPVGECTNSVDTLNVFTDSPSGTCLPSDLPAVSLQSSVDFKGDYYPVQCLPALDACVISYVCTDGSFFLQLESDRTARENLFDFLRYKFMPCERAVAVPSVGLVCAALMSDGTSWRRAVIESVRCSEVSVVFVDVGGAGIVPASDLRQLPSDASSWPRMAHHCTLAGCDNDVDSVRLAEVTHGEVLSVVFTATDEPPFTVLLQFESGVQLTDVFAGIVNTPKSDAGNGTVDCSVTGVPERKCHILKIGHRASVVVCHVVSPSCFYVHDSGSTGQLVELVDAMYEHFSLKGIDDTCVLRQPVVGQVCASTFGEDGEDNTWYRSQVVSVDTASDTCELFYLDYGNTDVVGSELRELPLCFQSLPWGAVACCLAGVSCYGDDWDYDILQAFNELASNK